jgi:hypothetical protein
MDEGVAAADAVAESSAERWRFSGGSDSETGSSGGTHVAPSERWRSGWDGEFAGARIRGMPADSAVIPVASLRRGDGNRGVGTGSRRSRSAARGAAVWE